MCLCATSDLFEDNKVILKVVSLVDLVLVSVTDAHSELAVAHCCSSRGVFHVNCRVDKY